MIILGIDPGTAITGYGVVKKSKKLTCLGYGCIKTNFGTPMPERLQKLHKELSVLIKKYKPDILAVESLYFFKNLKTALPVSQAKGVILLAAAQNKITVNEYTPLQIKKVLVNYGWAEKTKVQKKTMSLLKLKKIAGPDDVADALATAICCTKLLEK